MTWEPEPPPPRSLFPTTLVCAALRDNNSQDAETNGQIHSQAIHIQPATANRSSGVQLTKEDEQAVGDEVEVRREDQDKINKFSRLHQRELKYEEELKTKSVRIFLQPSMTWQRGRKTNGLCRKRKRSSTISQWSWSWPTRMTRYRQYKAIAYKTHCSAPDTALTCRYKIGDSFFHVTVSQAQGMLEASTTRIEEDVTQLEERLSTAREEMTQLKVELYARFGRSINLET